MLGNGPVRFGGRPHGKGPGTARHLAVRPTQCEELFTSDVCPQSRAEFLDVLHTMSQPSMPRPAMVVIGLRSDALGRCVDIPELADAVQSRCMVLGSMKRAELRDVVMRPVKMAGLRIEAGLVDVILNDIGADEKSPDAARLPLLSHALAGTWKRRKDGQLMTIAGYRDAGGVRGSVAETGEEAWYQLDKEQRTIVRRMLLRLVTIGEGGYDICRKEPTQELLARFPDAENAANVLETLTAARLLTINDSGVTFTHEIVLRAWPRLAGWIDDDRTSAPIRQRAENDAAAWIKNGRHKSFLQTGARLEATISLLGTVQEVDPVQWFDPCVAEFADASLRRQRRVTRAKWGRVARGNLTPGLSWNRA